MKEYITNLDAVKIAQPELYELVYPKAYQYVPKNYTSPKQFAETLLTFIGQVSFNKELKMDVVVGDKDTTLSALASFLRRAAPYQLPSFFVDKEFYKSMYKTDIHQGIDYSNISLPFPSQILYLPNDIEEEYQIKETSKDKQIQVIGLSKYTTTKGEVQYIYFHIADDYIRFIAKNSENIENYITTLIDYKAAKPFQLAINILLAKSARPNLYSSGTRIKSGKKSTRELWTPNFIGKGYKIKEEGDAKLFKGNGTHSSPRLHWRRGHFRNQHFGIKNAEQKIIWIEPTLVGVTEDEEGN